MRSILIPLLLALLAACSAAPPPAAPPPAEVRAVTLRPQPAAITASYPATVEAVQEVEVRARTSGMLERRLVAEGQPVRRGQVLFVLDRQPLRDALVQAEAALSQARAQAEQATRDLQRVQALISADAVSQQELDAARAREQGTRAAVSAAEAALQIAQNNLGYAEITAPIAGVMGRALLKEGALVSAYSSLLTTLYAVDPLYVNFALSEGDVAALERHHGPLQQQPPKFVLLQADGRPLDLVPALDLVDPAVDPATGTLGLRLKVENAGQRLRPGQYLRVQVTQRELADALLLPQRAVNELQGKHFAWVVNAEGKAERRDLQLGPEVGAARLVLAGLKAGDLVVTDGGQRLRPNQPLKVLTEPAGPGGGA